MSIDTPPDDLLPRLVLEGFDVVMAESTPLTALIRGVGRVWYGHCGSPFDPRKPHYHIQGYKAMSPKVLEGRRNSFHMGNDLDKVIQEIRRRINRDKPDVTIVAAGTRQITRTVRVISVEGIELTSDHAALLEHLCEANMLDVCVVYDNELRKKLFQAGLISESSRGGVWATERLRKNLDKILAAL